MQSCCRDVAADSSSPGYPHRVRPWKSMARGVPGQ